jgi:uncharacterized protein
MNIIMAQAPVIWHYPRAVLARELVDAMHSRTLMRGVIYAQRRKGKTAFLLNDLAPAATKAGFTIAYASLWANANEPHSALLEGLQQAAKSGFTDKLSRLSLGIEVAGIGKIEGEIERAAKPGTASAASLAALQTLLARLAKPKKPLLLLIDEIQHLATAESFRVFAYFLRTQLETLGDSLRVIFTGSSRAGLARTFGAPDMPFYQSATSLRFPDLDPGFFKHLAECFRAASGRRLTIGDVAALERLYEEMGRSPFFPVQALRLMILERLPDATSAIERFREDWQAIHRAAPLGQVEQWIMDCITRGARPYDAASLDALALKLGKSREAARQSVKRALAELQAMALIMRTARGRYEKS